MSLFEGADQAPKFEDLVGEDKRFKSPDELAKAKVEADKFVEQLKRETALLREELTARTPAVDRTQEILDQLEALKQKEPVMERAPIQPTEQTTVKGLSLDDVEKVIQQREARLQSERNINSVKQKLIEKFGDNYGTALKQIAESNGLTAKALDDLAASAPQLVLNLFGSTKTERPFVPPASSVQPNGGFNPTASGHKTRSWWNELKAKDKTTYLSKEMQQRQYKDAMALGEAFEDV